MASFFFLAILTFKTFYIKSSSFCFFVEMTDSQKFLFFSSNVALHQNSLQLLLLFLSKLKKLL